MAIVTKAFAVEDALLELLRGIEALDGAEILLGLPAVRADRQIWISGDHEIQETYQVSGLNEMEESFDVELNVFRRAPVRTYAEIRTLAAADADAIQAALGADPTLGGLCQLGAVSKISTHEGFTDDTHRACRIELTVTCSTVVQ